MQDGGKRKEAMKKNLLSLSYTVILYSNIFKHIRNKLLFTSAIINLHLSINLLPNIRININNFVGKNVNNYNDIKSYFIISNYICF